MKVTDEQMAYVQRPVDDSFAVFKAAIARGRGMNPKQLENVTDGPVHVGVHAKALCLIDNVGSLETSLAGGHSAAPKMTGSTTVERKPDMTTAQSNYANVMAEHSRLRAETARLKQQSTFVPPATTAPAIREGCEAVDGATERFEDLVEHFKSRGLTESQAVSAAVKKNPALHHAMLAEVNADRPPALAARRLTCGAGR